jgi:hypothetical protein
MTYFLQQSFNQEIEIPTRIFDDLSLRIDKIQNDPSHFSLVISHTENQENQIINLELIVQRTIEQFAISYVRDEVINITQGYFIPLHNTPCHGKTFNIEIDIIETLQSIYYFEAYCYNQDNKLVAKSGISCKVH